MENKIYSPIKDYGIIGNGKTTVLINKTGSIDFFCFPHFDSPSVFAKLLDRDAGGYFNTQPKGDDYQIHQNYIDQTNVLLTRFIATRAVVDIIDFMPFDDESEFPNEYIRIVKCIRGTIDFSFELIPKLNYGRSNHTISSDSKHEAIFNCDDTKIESLQVISNIEISDTKSNLITSFSLKEGKTAIFRIGEILDSKSDNSNNFIKSSRKKLRKTVKYWQHWIKKSTYQGNWKVEVDRSALLLKLLTSSEHGVSIAAPTFSLPETLGGDKNWDYRYAWVRDASFTMYAFIRLGFLEEASRFIIWIKNRLKQDLADGVELQIMYRTNGNRDLEESTLENFEGYKKSDPVRIGNEATNQLQLDIYGELLDTIYLFDKYGESISYEFWQLIQQLIEIVIGKWDQPDHGIWEVRETKRSYLYSRVMCWVAIDRAIRLALKHSFPFDRERWIPTRDQIFDDVYNNFWDKKLQSYVHFKNASSLDISLMIMPLVRMISPYDSRWSLTMEAIEKKLMTDVLIYRNMNDTNPKSDDNDEGTFLIGAFWYVECLSRAGQLEKASYYFQKIMNYSNHLGLFSEEIDADGSFLGNFPQAFSHLGLISAAFSLNRNQKDATFNVITTYDLF
ncbi:glycoside hydrolase family 15 protein [Aquimarina addita]|uniref:Glycoside hydrolase family 15 protein n=1 Tax=Aquimarina addita TaxID=870485 RepID=A0ABP7XHH7_9FLAO